MITAAEIRKAYPSPVSCLDCSSNDTCSYCVGGALCRYMDPESRSTFPCRGNLSNVLCKANPMLARAPLGEDMPRSYTFASEIAASNDDRRFDDAWAHLDEALSYHPTMLELLAEKEEACSL